MNRFHRHRRLNTPIAILLAKEQSCQKCQHHPRNDSALLAFFSISVSLELFFKHTPLPQNNPLPKIFPHFFFPRTPIYSAALYYIQRTLQTLSFEVTLTFWARWRPKRHKYFFFPAPRVSECSCVRESREGNKKRRAFYTAALSDGGRLAASEQTISGFPLLISCNTWVTFSKCRLSASAKWLCFRWVMLCD